jgi:flagellar protein FliO/FliZ
MQFTTIFFPRKPPQSEITMRLALLFACANTSYAFAGDAALKVLPPAVETPIYASSMLPTLGSLALVIVAILATGFFLRRINPNLRHGSSLLKPVAQLSVGPKEKLVVLEFQGELLVLGVTAHQITLVSKGTPNENLAKAADVPTEGALVTKWFARLRPPSSQGNQAASEH